MKPNAERIKEIFLLALEKKPAERESYLAESCQNDLELRQQVEALLLAHEQAGKFLTVKVTPSALGTEVAGTRIGRYKLLELIGEGGFGSVWMAEQEEPVRRQVALKVIKAGMDTRQVLARFEAERQALAMMDHPNIARVFDGGATENGRPYFVMELVRGIPITEYCDANKLSTGQRLALFIQVCQAVQHAHQKGIIHRDLKPSNILVTEVNGAPAPKVIDFGIAKAMQARLTDVTLFTGLHQMVGTPAYMSPEQAGLGALDMDTRSDIYALGVLLYELLTGQTPLTREDFDQAGMDEIFRLIREEDPPKPSTRLSALTREELTTVAARRQAEPVKLNRMVSGDLDWIVMKALEKDRRRRYETAGTLAEDIERHLKNEPVAAAPPSWSYLAGKTVRKHRRAVAVAAALAFLLIAGTTVSLWQAARATREARLADLSRQAAAKAQAEAELSQKEVSHQLARQYVDNGAQLLNSNDYFGSLVWFTEALRLDDGNPDAGHLQRVRIGAILRESPKLFGVFLHKNNVSSVDFSADGRRLLTASSDGTARIWDAVTGTQLVPPMKHDAEVVSAVFSPDGQRVATASMDNTARIWDAATGAPVTPPLRHGSNVFCAAFSPDGRRVVTSSADKTARVWDAVTGEPVTPPLRHNDTVWPAAFSPDGRFVVTASQDHTARVWNAATGRPVTPPLKHAGKVWWAAFSSDGRLVATACEDHTARLWDAVTGAPVGPPMEHAQEVIYVAFSPDGKSLVTASGESIFRIMDGFKEAPGEARVWEVATGKPLTPPMQHKMSVFQALFSPDGRHVATASLDHTARLWDAKTGEAVIPPLTHNDAVFRVAFTPDGQRLATACFDNAARIWGVGDRGSAEPPSIELDKSFLTGGYRFSPDGRLIAGKNFSGEARVWNVFNGASVTPPLHTNVAELAFSPDSRLLATAGADHTGRIWDANTGAAVTPPLWHDGEVFWIAFSPDSQRVITASADNTARIWSAKTGAALVRPLQHTSNVLCAAFSRDGRWVATASDDCTARVWDASTGVPVTGPLRHGSGVRLVVFSPDSRRVLTATRDGSLRVWDGQTGAGVTPRIQEAGDYYYQGIQTMSFSPDGHRFVIADNNNNSARVWNADTGAPVTPPLVHGDAVSDAEFSPDGRYVVTTSRDKTARVWDAMTGQPFTPAFKQRGPMDCAMFTADNQAVKAICEVEGFANAIIETWSLAPDNRSTSELGDLSQKLALRRLDASGVLVPLDFDTVTNSSFILTQ
jgi:WD40 repeat protein